MAYVSGKYLFTLAERRRRKKKWNYMLEKGEEEEEKAQWKIMEEMV